MTKWKYWNWHTILCYSWMCLHYRVLFVLHLDVLRHRALSCTYLDFSALQRPLLYQYVVPWCLSCTWTFLHNRGLWFSWTRLHHRELSCFWTMDNGTCLDNSSLCCFWTCLDYKVYRNLCCSWTCLHYRGLCCTPKIPLTSGAWASPGHVYLSTLQRPVLHMDLSTPQGHELHLNVSTPAPGPDFK